MAQDLVSWDRDVSCSPEAGRPRQQAQSVTDDLVALLRAVRQRVERVRLLYLYPSGLTDELIEAIGASGCPYFDLSLQHVSAPLLRRMRRFGDGEKFLRKIAAYSGPFSRSGTAFVVHRRLPRGDRGGPRQPC